VVVFWFLNGLYLLLSPWKKGPKGKKFGNSYRQTEIGGLFVSRIPDPGEIHEEIQEDSGWKIQIQIYGRNRKIQRDLRELHKDPGKYMEIQNEISMGNARWSRRDASEIEENPGWEIQRDPLEIQGNSEWEIQRNPGDIQRDLGWEIQGDPWMIQRERQENTGWEI
jgi:hypothetical protein